MSTNDDTSRHNRGQSPPLTHEQRQALIHQPLPQVCVIGGKSHGGCAPFKTLEFVTSDIYPDVTLWRE